MTEEQEIEKPKVAVAKKRKKAPQVEAATNVVPIRGGMPIEVLGADETYANKMHIKIMGLMRQYEETYFKLAEALYEVRTRKLYKALDGKYNTFEEYAESVGVEYRKARYLVSIWEWYGIKQEKNPVLLEGAQEIGWTKARYLVGVVDGRNASRWFDLAKTMNQDELSKAARIAKKHAEEKKKERAKESSRRREEASRTSMVGGEPAGQKDEEDEPDEQPRPMTTVEPKPPEAQAPAMPEPASQAFEDDGIETDGIDPPDNIKEEVEAKKQQNKEWQKYILDVHVDNVETVKSAFRYASELAESNHQGHIFSLICLHYVSFYDQQKSVVMGEWLAQLERLSGLSLVAIDQRTKEIVYGSDLIEELAATGEDDVEVDDERE
jgi:hypothetical protein